MNRPSSLVLAASVLTLASCRDVPVEPDQPGGPVFAAKVYYGSSVASSINTQGQAVGWSGDFPVLLAFLWTPRGANGANGSMVSLGTLGGSTSEAWHINTQGQVVGKSDIANDAATHAFLWTPRKPNDSRGSMIDLGTLGGTSSGAAGINTQGEVVGYSYVSGDAAVHAFLWKPTRANAATGVMVDLGTLNGVDAAAGGINAQGQVAGTSGGHVFLWTPSVSNGTTGTMVDLGPGQADDINAQGQVVGLNGAGHAFLWTPTTANGSTGSMVDLGTFGGPVSRANGVNAQGQVVGYAYLSPDPTTGNSYTRPFLWTPATANGTTGTMTDLGTFGGHAGVAYGINTQGQVAGWSYYPGGDEALTGGHGFIWRPTTSNGTTGSMTDIGTLRK